MIDENTPADGASTNPDETPSTNNASEPGASSSNTGGDETGSGGTLPAPRSKQDVAMANLIGDAEKLLKTVVGDAEIVALLGPSGYPLEKLQAGQALTATALTKYTDRQSSEAQAVPLKEARDAAHTVVHEELIDYRATVQANFKGPLRKALRGGGRIPGDMEVFATEAISAYTTAGQPPHAEVLTQYGFGAERLAAAIARVVDFKAKDHQFKGADQKMTQATADRNQAVAELRAWLGKFKKIAKVALRKRPDLQQKLAL